MTEKKYPSERQDQFIVRLPDGMRDRIRRAAEGNNRSMNAEIVATLEEKYPEPPDPTDIGSHVLGLAKYIFEVQHTAEREQRLAEANRLLRETPGAIGWTFELGLDGGQTVVHMNPPSSGAQDTDDPGPPSKRGSRRPRPRRRKPESPEP